MLSAAIWWIGNSLEAVLVFRGWRSDLFRRYPFFYAYSATVLAVNVPLAILNMFDPRLQSRLYWPTNYLTLFLGCGILIEILRHVMSHYPGANRLGVATCTGAFCLILVFIVIYRLIEGEGSIAINYWNTERDIRAVQAILLFALLFVITIYRIALGRNMQGMIVGYGIYIGASLMSLAIMVYARGFAKVWQVIQPFSYDVSLLIWMTSLWSYRPAPIPPKKSPESDYAALAAKTRRALSTMWSHLGRSVR